MHFTLTPNDASYLYTTGENVNQNNYLKSQLVALFAKGHYICYIS